MTLCLLYVTIDTRENAKKIAQTLLEEKLIACANILPAINSLYVWNDAVHDDEETVILFKTTEPNKEKTTARIKEIHPYDCPCILEIPVSSLNNAFEQWVYSSVSE